MRFLLDTNVVSELRKTASGKADRNVIHWASSVDGASLYLSSVTLMEIEIGILLIARRDHEQGARLRRWMERQLLPGFSERILPVDSAVALRCASLHVPNPHPERDSLIAATALVHGMTVATRNVKDFAGTGVHLFNPWEPQ